MTRRWVAFGGAAVIVVADQLTKALAWGNLQDGDVEVIPGLLRWHLSENPGSAFGLIPNGGPWLGVAAVVAVGIVMVALEASPTKAETAGLILVLGGAIGNLVDRVVRADGFLDGRVIDWIDFPVWPTFNIADSAITIGVVLMVLGSLRNR